MDETKPKRRMSIVSIICLILFTVTMAEATVVMTLLLLKNFGNQGNIDGGQVDRGYTITWLNDDGTVLEVDNNVAKNTTPSYDGTTPTKADEGLIHYTFNTWNHEVVPAIADATYVATYNVSYNNATVVFDLNGHEGDPIAPLSVVYGAFVTAPVSPTTAGHTFVGWYKEPSCSIAWNFATDIVTSDITLYAKWNVNYYTVSFDLNNEHTTQTIESQQVAYGGLVTKPQDPEDIVLGPYDGYGFDHWEYLGEDEYGDPVWKGWDFEHNVVTGNLVLRAHWNQWK